VGVLGASVPAVAFSGELTSAAYGGALPPMFAVVDLPPWASVVGVLVVPLLAELAEPVAYLGVVLPRLERRLGRWWLAATIVVAVWAAEHASYPLLTGGGGGLELGFVAYRVGSVLAFLAAWTAAYYALGRRLLPVMAARWVLNGGTALALALGLVE
jgi:membrane protease YdiL (CAAX protease family)